MLAIYDLESSKNTVQFTMEFQVASETVASSIFPL